MDILKSSQLVIFSHSTIFITFSYRSLAGFLFKLLRSFEAAKTGSGVGFLRLTAVWCAAGLLLSRQKFICTRAAGSGLSTLTFTGPFTVSLPRCTNEVVRFSDLKVQILPVKILKTVA